MKNRTRAVLGMVLVAVLVTASACQAPPPTVPTGPVQVEITNWDAAAALAGDFAPAEESRAAGNVTTLRSLRVQRDLTVGNDAAVGGDMTITGGLSVTGGVTGTNVLTTGNQTIAGIKTFSTPAVVPGLTGPLTLTGPTAVATATPAMIINNLGAANNAFEVRDAATPVFVVGQAGAIAAGLVNSSIPVLAKTSSYAVTAANTGAIIKSSGSITMTLPAAVVGLNYCLYNYDGGDLTIDFTDTADVALNEVNSPGDRVTNTTAFDSICLTAIDTTNWVTISSLGTWADGN